MAEDTVLQTETGGEAKESFGEMLSLYERNHSHAGEEGSRQLRGTVVSVSGESVFVDIGYKTEGVLPLAAFGGEAVAPGDALLVSVKGRNEDGYYDLSKLKVEQPKDWESLQEAFAAKSIVAGTVTGVVKGGVTVDVGVRAFLPASRSGTRDAAELEKLVGQQIECRITKIDVEDEDVVVDRRAVLEEQERGVKERRFAEVNEGDVVSGTVRSVTSYGAFIDLGGVDGLLHVGEISWARIAKPEDVLTVGETVEVKVLKIEAESRRISLSMKQLLPHPWEAVPVMYTQGDRVRGTVSRTAEFGAFVELASGIEGLIHISEMSWAKKVRKPDDLVKVGDTVEAVILGINLEERRISLGLKQALGDPWVEAASRLVPGAVVEGPISSFTKFGAFVQVAEGIEGMVHISEITAEKRLNHPQDVLRSGQIVKAKVLEFDREKRQLRLSIKQMVPTGADEFFAEHQVGDTVTGRVVEFMGEHVRVELGEGVLAQCSLQKQAVAEEPSATSGLDLSSLTSLLSSKWKGSAGKSTPAPPTQQTVQPGQVRSFRIVGLDAEAKGIALELN